jgi:UDP-glucose 4-epimerase
MFGAENVIETAAINGVTVVVLSTDKAVYPINTMGLTKALMEKLAISKDKVKIKMVVLFARQDMVM